MNTLLFQKALAHGRRIPLWAWEISILAAATTPLLQAVAVLDRLPPA